MVAGSILPVSFNRKGKLVFLFGKENSMENSSKGWSDFGGGCEHSETPFQTALREGGEELTFFLGDGKELKKLIQKNGGFYSLVNGSYHIHLFYIEYDENLPKYYNANHTHLWKHMDPLVLNRSKLFEKAEIAWYTLNDIHRRMKEFRRFYQDIVKQTLLPDISSIHQFIVDKHRKNILTKK
jgi:8-oxo-dGTP pyrophosphatase MutT (NUDIX family)